MNDETPAQPRVSFFAKNPLCCPVCQKEFHREELLTGRGRNIAGKLGVDLRRFWEENPKYGKVVPLLYSVTVCPYCLYATYASDFMKLMKDVESCQVLASEYEKRKTTIENLLDNINFIKERTIKEGIASYILALMCYDHLPIKMNPTFKSALSCLRLGWLCDDAHSEMPYESYDYLALLFYTKATFLYQQVEEKELTEEEPLDNIRYFGPDSDFNYGYDSVLYLAVLLLYYFGSKKDKKIRKDMLAQGRTTLSRIVGMGESSKERPSSIIDKAREIHNLISKEYKALEEELKTS